MKNFMDQISNPTKVIKKTATYEAIMKQRRILLDQSFLNLSGTLIDEQINNDLLTEHVFPFHSMTITQEGNILVTWEKQLNDPVIAMQLNSEGMNLIVYLVPPIYMNCFFFW